MLVSQYVYGRNLIKVFVKKGLSFIVVLYSVTGNVRILNPFELHIYSRLVSDFFRFKDTDPKEVMVTIPQELYRAPRNENMLRNSLRRSFRLVP